MTLTFKFVAYINTIQIDINFNLIYNEISFNEEYGDLMSFVGTVSHTFFDAFSYCLRFSLPSLFEPIFLASTTAIQCVQDGRGAQIRSDRIRCYILAAASTALIAYSLYIEFSNLYAVLSLPIELRTSIIRPGKYEMCLEAYYDLSNGTARVVDYLSKTLVTTMSDHDQVLEQTILQINRSWYIDSCQKYLGRVLP